MADNTFQSIFTVEFEDFASIKHKLDILKKKLENSNTSGIKVDIDTKAINNILDDVTKLSKTNIQILPNGQIKMVNTLNDELGKTVKLATDLSTGKTKIDINNDFEKQMKAEQNLADAMAKGRENAEIKKRQEIKKTEEAQSKAINKAIEESKKIEQNTKDEEARARKLIDLEKQKLQLKQKNIEINRGSLVDKESSKDISSKINNLDGKSIEEVKEKAKNLDFELQKLDQDAKLKGVSVGQKNVSSLGDAFKETASKLGIFISTTMVLREIMQQLKDATQYIIDMDTSMSNIMMITGETSSQIQKVTSDFKNLGSELHTTNREIMTSSEEMLRAGYDAKTSQQMMEASVIGSKLSAQTSKEVSEQLIAIKNAFDMTGDEMNGVIDKMAEMDRTSATSFKELAEATKRTAFSAREMGTSFTDLLAYITTVSEKTRKPAESIGEGWKTIFSRFSNLKLGNLDDEGKSINDVETALARLDIKLRDTKGSFRDFDVVLKEFLDKVKSGNVNQIDKLAVVQSLAGTRQKEVLLGLISNIDALEKHQQDLVNSTGMAKEMFDNVYSESLDARINDLNRSFENLYESILNSSTLKLGLDISTGTINGISTLVNKFGALPTTITTVIGALTLFNSKFRESTSTLNRFVLESTGLQTKIDGLTNKFNTNIRTLKNDIKITKELIAENEKTGISTVGLSAKLTQFQGQLTATTIKLAMTKVATIALQTAMSMGITLIITGLISKLSSFVDSLITTKAELKELNDEFNNTFSDKQNSIKSAESLVSQYEKLQKELSGLQNNTEEYKTKEQELADVQSQLIGLYPQSSSAIDGNTDSKSINLEKTKELIEQDKLLAQSKATEILDKNKVEDADDVLKLANATKQYREEMQKYVDLKNQGVNEVKVETYDEFGLKVPKMMEINSLLRESTKNYEDNKTKLDAVTNAISMMSDKNVTFKDVLSEVNSIINDNTENINNNTNAKEKNDNTPVTNISENLDNVSTISKTEEIETALKSLGLTAEDVAKKMKDINIEDGIGSSELISTATKQYGEMTNEINSAYEMINKISESSVMTADIISSLASKYPEMGSAILNASDSQEFLNNKIKDMEAIQGNAISIMMGNSSEYYSQLLNETDNLQKVTDDFCGNFVDVHSDAYNVDVNNFSTANEAKDGIGANLTNAMADYIARWTGGNAENYQIDLNSFGTLAEKKTYILAKLDEQIAKVQHNYENLITTTKASRSLADSLKKVGGEGRNSLLDIQAQGLSSLADNAEKQLNALKNERQKVETSYNEFITGFNKGVANYVPNSSAYGGNNKDKKDKKSQTEKQVEDIESLVDRYYELDNALKDVENDLANINTLEKNAKGKEKNRLLQEEVALLNKKRSALQSILDEQQREKQDYRTALYTQGGFTFNGDDSIHNYMERMEALKNYANSFSNADEKKNAQDYYKNLEKMVKEYTDLINNEIPKTKNQIDEIQNEIISAQENIADSLKEQKDKYVKNLEDTVEKTKKKLKEAQDFMHKDWKDKDNEDEMADKEKKLAQLEADLTMALRNGDKALADNIRNQIIEAQNELNQFVRDAEREAMDERFENETDKLDEDLENKLKLIEEKFGDENLLALVQQGVTDLSSALNSVDDSTKNVNRTFYGLSNSVEGIAFTMANSWVEGLDKVIDKAKELSAVLPSSFDMTGNINTRGNNGNSFSFGDTQISINGSTKEEINRNIDDKFDDIKNYLKQAIDEFYR